MAVSREFAPVARIEQRARVHTFGCEPAEISHPGYDLGEASPRKALSIHWLERLAHAVDSGMGFAFPARREHEDFELGSGGITD